MSVSEGSPSQSPQAPSSSESDLGPLSPWSCQRCRLRKLKCNRVLPVCGRCVKIGETCDYPSARKKPVINPANRPRLRDMQSRIRDLEARLEAQNSPPEFQPFSASTELIDTGRFEGLPPPHLVDELTSIYFTKLQSDSFMIHGERYIASLYRPAHMQPPMCLQYAILAAGASASPTYKHMAELFYSDADQISLAHCQTWVLISHFEAQHLWFSRGSMSIARAIRLAHILGLHRLDGKNVAGLTLPAALDFTEQEERRKTFWVIFTTDRITSSTGGWPTMMDWRSIQTRLPSSIDAFLSSTPIATLTLRQALGQGMYELSTSACRVVAVHLFNECFNFSRNVEEDEDSNDWQQLQQLDEAVTNAFATLPLDLRCPENMESPEAVLINLQLHTALICIHKSALTRSQVDMAALPTTKARVMESAVQIMITVALVTDLSTRFRNPLVSFATFIAASFFLSDFLTTGDLQSEANFTALMTVMVEVGKSNMFAASLAVRLAHTLRASGVDQGTVGKAGSMFVMLCAFWLKFYQVGVMMADLNIDHPIPGQEDKENGIVILCPSTSTPEQVELDHGIIWQ
ncbi:Zn(II)2Cys6 transcriptional activator [Fusarium beomiforme]|uniref:Zn(II)2Cys6 transcriptional activator n=1 Tax=Fusarium beomiforme TaxID=44412 RepID=A0A9P5AMM0_9HYPO|nr:Zn(II)2Cys6 transcriptional activator [Fusarium beomiforme]